ncbi:MAG: hypothetical protein ACK4F7_01815 [Inhella sp.]
MDSLDAYTDLLGEDMLLAGQPVRGVFHVVGEVVLDGILSTATTAELAASSAAAPGQTLVRDGVSYRIRQVLPVAPDGLLVQLVLAKV